MKREFLKELGLEDETINKVMSEYGKSVNDLKEQLGDLETLQSEKGTLEQQLSDLQDQLSSNEDKLQSLDDLEKQIENYKLNELKVKVARKTGVPFELAGRLTGSNEEELQADAERLAGFVNQKQTLPLKPTEPPVDDKDAGMKKMLENMNKNKGE